MKLKLRKNTPYDNPDYKYELDIDTNNTKLISQIVNSTPLFESNDETGVTLYSNNKQALLEEKQRIEQLFPDALANKKSSFNSKYRIITRMAQPCFRTALLILTTTNKARLANRIRNYWPNRQRLLAS